MTTQASRNARDAEIRRRRAKGVLIKTLVLEFGLSRSMVSRLCADVLVPQLRSQERAAISSKRRAIVLDAQTLAVIEDAKRNPGPPYKSALGWVP